MTEALSQKQVFKTDQLVIMPGEVGQLILKSPATGTVKGFVVGDGARPVKLWVGKQTVMMPEDTTTPRPPVDLPVTQGQIMMLTVQNVSEEPAFYQAAFALETDAPAPLPVDTSLTQKLEPISTTTAADLGVKPGKNEVAVCMTVNDANFLLDNLRNGNALTPVVKSSLIRRIDAELKPFRKK